MCGQHYLFHEDYSDKLVIIFFTVFYISQHEFQPSISSYLEFNLTCILSSKGGGGYLLSVTCIFVRL